MKNKKRLLSIPRLVVVLIGLQVCFLILIGKLLTLQVTGDASDRSRPRAKALSRKVSEVKRGKILDRQQTILGLSRRTLNVSADPAYLKTDPAVVANQLAPILDMPATQLLAQLKRKNKRFVSLKRGVDYQLLSEIRALKKKFHGITYSIEQKRSYPKGQLASHVIGHVNTENIGEGIEYEYNDVLLGITGGKLQLHSPYPTDTSVHPTQSGYVNTLLNADDAWKDVGYNVVLTLDEYIQYIAEKELAAACQKWNAPRGTAVVLASQTAEVLAMASYPTFTPNAYADTNEAAKRNLAVWYAYEPGSIFKIVGASAALNEAEMTPATSVFCENGRFRISRQRVIKDVSPKGWLTLAEVLHKSSNIGMIKIVQKIGPEIFMEYIEKYGFGRSTGIDLPYEHSGELSMVKRWNVNSLGAVPFGQGILVTPLQMVNALNVIATGGKLLRPYITKEILDNQGHVLKRIYPIEIRRVLRPEVARQMREILVGVVENGSGRRGQVEGYRVAGKTGTAQKAEKGIGYVNGKETMSFMGFLPAENPQISILVMLDEPKGARFSGQIAAPLFKNIAEQAMQYFKQTEFFVSEMARKREGKFSSQARRNPLSSLSSRTEKENRTPPPEHIPATDYTVKEGGL